MKLYHYSDNKNIKKLKVNYFSKNNYTYNDKKVSDLNRIFFYTNIESIEYCFKNKYCYTCDIPDKDIYNLQVDKLKLKQKYKYNIDTLLKNIKKRKYKGIYYIIGALHIVILFYDINVKMEA